MTPRHNNFDPSVQCSVSSDSAHHAKSNEHAGVKFLCHGVKNYAILKRFTMPDHTTGVLGSSSVRLYMLLLKDKKLTHNSNQRHNPGTSGKENKRVS